MLLTLSTTTQQSVETSSTEKDAVQALNQTAGDKSSVASTADRPNRLNVLHEMTLGVLMVSTIIVRYIMLFNSIVE